MEEEYPLHAVINQVLRDRRRWLTDKRVSVNLYLVEGGLQKLLNHLETNEVTEVTSDEVKAKWETLDREAAEEVKSLVDSGVNVHAKDEIGTTPLRLAVDSGNTQVVAVLLPDTLAGTKYGDAMLHVAVKNGDMEMTKLLLHRGADLSSKDEGGSAPLHNAVRSCNVKMVEMLLKENADPKVKEEDGSTVLHVAASSGNLEMLEFLLKHEVDLEARDNTDRTALHIAACYRSSKMAKVLLDRGADVTAENKTGKTALHFAACFSNTIMVSMLLSNGAKIDALDKTGNNPLSHLISAQQHELDNESVAVARLLCLRGSKPTLSESAVSALKDHQSGLLACAQYWHECFKKGKSLLNVSSNFIKGGAAAVNKYLSDLENTSERVNRCKICVIGPSSWGKTSFVKSVTDSAHLLVDADDRTIGIDRFSFTFFMNSPATTDDNNATGNGNAAKEERYDITIWDHAGQDIYQVSHPMFFSEKTLYILCIDLGKYYEKWAEFKPLSSVKGRDSMQRFFEENMLHWVRLVLLHQTNARFKVIGTKADLLKSDEGKLKRVQTDVRNRLMSFLKSDTRQVELEESAKKALGEDFDRNLVPTSVTTKDLALQAQEKFKQVVVAEEQLWEKMPKTYVDVLEYIVNLQRSVVVANSKREDQLKGVMLSVDTILSNIMNKFDDLSNQDCRDILATLDNLGDILWYKDGGNEQNHRVILDPTIVLDIISEVVNHEYEKKSGELYTALLRDGTLSHSLLMTFPLWKAMQACDGRMVHEFKHLLQRFNLAYPENNETNLDKADMIVPSYWLRNGAFRGLLSRQESLRTRRDIPGGHVAKWKYTLPVGISESIFVKFVVRSYRSDASRTVSGNRFECFVPGEFVVAIIFIARQKLYDEILIEAAGQSEDIAWAEMRFFVIAMEQIVKDYPGLESSGNREIKRCVVDARYNACKEYVVDEDGPTDDNWNELSLDMGIGKAEDQVRNTYPWLPPNFRWFLEKAWAVSGKIDELDVSRELTVLMKLTLHKEKRQFPALWTLSYPKTSSKITLRMHSDITGKCHHDALEIDAPTKFQQFVAKYPTLIRVGISALSIASNLIPFAVAGAAVSEVLDVPREYVDQACTAQSILKNANLFPGATTSSTNSAEREEFLFDLLKKLGLDAADVRNKSNLQCATTKDGSYVWLHNSEMDRLEGLTHLPDPPRPVLPEVKITLDIKSVEGLPESSLKIIKKQVYCSWQLIHNEDTANMNSGETGEVVSTPEGTASWSSKPLELKRVNRISMLSQCNLQIQLNHAHRFTGCFREDALLGEGETTIAPPARDNTDKSYSITVPVALPPGNMNVTCQVVIKFPSKESPKAGAASA